MHDLVIRNGLIIDGTGAKRYGGDIAIDQGRITDVGSCVGRGTREINAYGMLVTPGWVDLHTHYDAQVTWDPYVTPSSWHGVTTVVMGNCGVGFAPVDPAKRDWLIGLMEGVEDIPGAAMTEGMKWEWESFPEYLDAIGGKRRAIDIAAQVPHGALRAYVMGDRAHDDLATSDDVGRMATIVRDSIRAGAVGFSTSRTMLHKGSDGKVVPGTYAGEEELFGIGRVLGELGRGVFQMTSNHKDMATEFPWMRKLAAETGRTVSFNLVQCDEKPELWKHMLGLLSDARAEGVPIIAQVAGRPAGVLMGWETTVHPFMPYPTYFCIAQQPIAERVATLRDPAVRAKLITEDSFDAGELANLFCLSFDKMYGLGEQPEYEPDPSLSVAARAASEGRRPQEIIYDLLMENDGRGLIYFPMFNYTHGNTDHMRELLMHPGTVLGLSDGGAHCGAICDASMPTYMLTQWGRDRPRGNTVELEQIVKWQTRDTAEVYGLFDRGVIAPGAKADINVIDFDALRLHAPRLVHDLPADGRRLIQRADGYRYTISSGEVIMEMGEPTGVLPGVLIRGEQRHFASTTH